MTLQTTSPRGTLWLLTVTTMLATPALAQDAAAAPTAAVVKPSHVYARVQRVRSDIEHIRFSMGKPKTGDATIRVTSAAPREVYYQALTLFLKADQLCFEQARERTEPPAAPTGTIQPAHVRDMVDAALGRVQVVKRKLGISRHSDEPAPVASHTPTDVFMAIVEANQQLNILLAKPFTPSDVFREVTVAVSYAARLLAQFPEAQRIPPAPEFQEGKQPQDVYRRLVGCYANVRKIGSASGLQMLELGRLPDDLDHVTPSHVYDVAALLVSELSFIHSQAPDIEPARPGVYPGRKFPSHVYQRAGILEAQLAALAELVQANPQWLK